MPKNTGIYKKRCKIVAVYYKIRIAGNIADISIVLLKFKAKNRHQKWIFIQNYWSILIYS